MVMCGRNIQRCWQPIRAQFRHISDELSWEKTSKRIAIGVAVLLFLLERDVEDGAVVVRSRPSGEHLYFTLQQLCQGLSRRKVE